MKLNDAAFKWSERNIQLALAWGIFDYRRFVVVPNVSHGLLRDRGEQDLVVMTAAGYVTEIEIKISVGDLRAELAKDKHRGRTEQKPFGNFVKRYYIAAPSEVWERAGDVELPVGAGRISTWIDDWHYPRTQIVEESVVNKVARALSAEERMKLLRLGYLRIWVSREYSDAFPRKTEAVA